MALINIILQKLETQGEKPLANAENLKTLLLAGCILRRDNVNNKYMKSNATVAGPNHSKLRTVVCENI
jgi:hypothetical protein